MSSNDDLSRLKTEIRRLRAHNRRYRELVQNLASRLAILGDRAAASSSGPPVLTAFESFGRLEEPEDESLWEGPLREIQLRKADASDGLTPERDLKPLVPNPGWRCLAVDRPQLRIGFTLFGMTDGEIEKAVAVIEQRQVRTRDFVPVFFTDRMQLGPYRSRGYVVEYVRAGYALDERLDFLSTKWGLHKLVHLGQKIVGGKD